MDKILKPMTMISCIFATVSVLRLVYWFAVFVFFRFKTPGVNIDVVYASVMFSALFGILPGTYLFIHCDD